MAKKKSLADKLKATAPKVKKGKKKKEVVPEVNSRVKHPEVKMFIYGESNPITAKQSKQILGWTEETDDNKFETDYLLKDAYGTKIRCVNNETNRPLSLSNCLALQAEILQGWWVLNGEPIIIGRFGNVLNGQHSLIALILATQEFALHGGSWDYWEAEPTLQKMIVTGISEEDKVVNTLDTCKVRTLTEVIFRSPLFVDFTKAERLKASGYLARAVQMMWDRTGAYLDAYQPRRTHAQSFDFMDRHPTLVKCVKHLLGEAKNLAPIFDPGMAAALLYLMAASDDPRETETGKGYCDVNRPSEKSLSLARFDKACDFFTLLAGHSDELGPAADAIAEIATNGWMFEERVGVLVLAWNEFVAGNDVTPASVRLSVGLEENEEDGSIWRTLLDVPVVGGIDLGGKSAAE